jgi:hypothetical protein
MARRRPSMHPWGRSDEKGERAFLQVWRAVHPDFRGKLADGALSLSGRKRRLQPLVGLPITG